MIIKLQSLLLEFNLQEFLETHLAQVRVLLVLFKVAIYLWLKSALRHLFFLAFSQELLLDKLKFRSSWYRVCVVAVNLWFESTLRIRLLLYVFFLPGSDRSSHL